MQGRLLVALGPEPRGLLANDARGFPEGEGRGLDEGAKTDTPGLGASISGGVGDALSANGHTHAHAHAQAS